MLSKPEPCSFPLISNVGKFTGLSVGTFLCHKSQYIATVIATIAARLQKRLKIHNTNHVVVKSRRLIIRSACYYAITKNAWFIDRFLHLSRNLESGKKSIEFLVCKFVSAMDDYSRFVYSQVCLQTNWLLLRASRPRDKSRYNMRSPLWKKEYTLSTFLGDRSRVLRIASFDHVFRDVVEICGPRFFGSFNMALKPGSICLYRRLQSENSDNTERRKVPRVVAQNFFGKPTR